MEANEARERIARIWAEALGVESVGADEDFFELGGHSLLAGEVIAATCREFSVRLPVRTLFAAPTVAELTTAVLAAQSSPAPAAAAIPRAARRPLKPLAEGGDPSA